MKLIIFSIKHPLKYVNCIFFFRTILKHDDAFPDIEILEPINLELLVKRNLAATWFNKIPGMEVKGVLKSMNVSLF